MKYVRKAGILAACMAAGIILAKFLAFLAFFDSEWTDPGRAAASIMSYILGIIGGIVFSMYVLEDMK